MAENHPHNLGFKEESIVVQHAVFALLVDTLNNQIQAKYQSMPVSPFETHRRVMSAFFVEKTTKKPVWKMHKYPRSGGHVLSFRRAKSVVSLCNKFGNTVHVP